MCPASSADTVIDTPGGTISGYVYVAISASAVILLILLCGFCASLDNHHGKKASNAQGINSPDPERNEEMPAYGIPVASKVDDFPHKIPVPVQWSPPPPSAPPLYPNE
jgi:hypothetical protein